MLMSPVSGMNVNQCNLFAVTRCATFIGFAPIMAFQTDAHWGHVRRSKCSRFCDGGMTILASEFLGNMLLMAEFNLPFVVGDGLWFLPITVTHTAFLVVADVVVALPTDFHRWHHAILWRCAALCLGMTGQAFYSVFSRMQSVREDNVTGRHG
jgi:hypothetical protein